MFDLLSIKSALHYVARVYYIHLFLAVILGIYDGGCRIEVAAIPLMNEEANRALVNTL